MKKIKALVSFVYIGANGSITSYAGGQVYEVPNDMATQMISIGYAEEYSEGGGGNLYSLATNILQTVSSGEKNLTWSEDDGYYYISFEWYTPTFDINTIESYYRNINIKVGESQLSAEYVPTSIAEPLTVGNYMIMLYFADGHAFIDIGTQTVPSESAVTVKYGETDVYTCSNDLKTLFPNKF